MNNIKKTTLATTLGLIFSGIALAAPNTINDSQLYETNVNSSNIDNSVIKLEENLSKFNVPFVDNIIIKEDTNKVIGKHNFVAKEYSEIVGDENINIQDNSVIVGNRNINFKENKTELLMLKNKKVLIDIFRLKKEVKYLEIEKFDLNEKKQKELEEPIGELRRIEKELEVEYKPHGYSSAYLPALYKGGPISLEEHKRIEKIKEAEYHKKKREEYDRIEVIRKAEFEKNKEQLKKEMEIVNESIKEINSKYTSQEENLDKNIVKKQEQLEVVVSDLSNITSVEKGKIIDVLEVNIKTEEDIDVVLINTSEPGENSTLLGHDIINSGNNSIAIGNNSNNFNDDSIVIGVNSYNEGKNSVVLGKDSTNDRDNVVSIGSKELTRKVINMSEGEISETSKEGINGSQLFGYASSIAKAIDKDATIDKDGNVTNIKFNINGKEFTNVKDAIIEASKSSSGGSSTNINVGDLEKNLIIIDSEDGKSKTISLKTQNVTLGDIVINNDDGKVTGVKEGAIVKGSTDVVTGGQLFNTNQIIKNTVKYDSNDKNTITLNGVGGTVITNVKDGEISKGSMDAINGGQVSNIVTNINDQFNGVDNKINAVEKRLSKGIASSVAMNIDYPDLDVGDVAIGVGVGGHGSEQALAIGGTYLSENGKIKLGTSFARAFGKDAKATYRASAAYKF